MAAHELMQRSNDLTYQFEQESNFWYLCGIDAPRWSLVYDGIRDHTWLIMPSVSEVERAFDGELSAEHAIRTSGADEVIAADELPALLRQLRRTHASVYSLPPPKRSKYMPMAFNPAIAAMHRMLERNFVTVHDCTLELGVLQAIKQPEELKMLSSSVRTTIDAFSVAYKKLQACHYEYEIQAEFDYVFSRRGARHGYDPIVASGRNACTLHYNTNNARLRSQRLVMIDIGARHGHYSADITRTYAYGEPTARQRTVYQALRDAQSDIIDLLEPGLPIREYAQAVDQRMAQALRSLGLSAADDTTLVRTYMPHAVSHGLGVDLHSRLGVMNAFEPGMVLTVEPGIYIPRESFGARIEDDIVITPRGSRNLSRELSTDL